MTMIDAKYKTSAWQCALILTALVLTACAGGPETTDTDAPFADIGTTQNSSRAVTTLLAKVDTQEQQANWERAAALLERALRIEPRNAGLWHRLAKVRLQQGRYAMAESLAQKSNALAGDDGELKQRNVELIEAARHSMAAG